MGTKATLFLDLNGTVRNQASSSRFSTAFMESFCAKGFRLQGVTVFLGAGPVLSSYWHYHIHQMLFDAGSSSLLDLSRRTLIPQAVWSPFKGLEGKPLCFLPSSAPMWLSPSRLVPGERTIFLWVNELRFPPRWIEEDTGKSGSRGKMSGKADQLSISSWIESSQRVPIIGFAGLWINQTLAESIHIVWSKTNPDLREKRVVDYIWS